MVIVLGIWLVLIKEPKDCQPAEIKYYVNPSRPVRRIILAPLYALDEIVVHWENSRFFQKDFPLARCTVLDGDCCWLRLGFFCGKPTSS